MNLDNKDNKNNKEDFYKDRNNSQVSRESSWGNYPNNYPTTFPLSPAVLNI